MCSYLAGIYAHPAYLFGSYQELLLLEVVSEHPSWSMLHDEVEWVGDKIWVWLRTHADQSVEFYVNIGH